MSTLILKPIDPKIKGTSWVLDFDEKRVSLANDAGEKQVDFPFEEAYAKMYFPNELVNSRNLAAIQKTNKETVVFGLEPADAEVIKKYLEACVAQNPESAIGLHQSKAIWSPLWAALCLIAGVGGAVFWWIFVPPADRP